MATYVQDGKSVDFVAGADLGAGDVVVLGALIGVTSRPVANGEVGALAICGVFEVDKLSTDDVSVGDELYWDAANSRLTLSATGNTRFGRAIAAAGSGETKVRALLLNV